MLVGGLTAGRQEMLEMSSYEMLDLAATNISAAVDDLNRALALGSAYLVMDYRAGRTLTKLQVSLINIEFVLFCGQALMGIYTELNLVAEFRSAALVEDDLTGSLANITLFQGVMGFGAV